MTGKMIEPMHLNIKAADLVGNNGIGRYIFLPGSDGRAKEIAQHFKNASFIAHPRGHNVYLGSIDHHGSTIDVATVATGMGCPSIEIIINELFHLGGKRFLRVGTAGSLQPSFVKVGDIVHAQASVRDEHTTIDYVPIEVPAIASYEFALPIMQAATVLGLSERVHSGIVHCKSSLYDREFGEGPSSEMNMAYMDLLTRSGVLATEMETSALFILSQLFNYELMQQGKGPSHHVYSGAILGIVDLVQKSSSVINDLIRLAIETVGMLNKAEQSL